MTVRALERAQQQLKKKSFEEFTESCGSSKSLLCSNFSTCRVILKTKAINFLSKCNFGWFWFKRFFLILVGFRWLGLVLVGLVGFVGFVWFWLVLVGFVCFGWLLVLVGFGWF